MFLNFSEEAKEVLMEAKKQKNLFKHPFVGSEHLLLAILKLDSDVKDKLNEYNITYETFKEEIIKTIGIGSDTNSLFLYTPLLKRIIENATIDSKEMNDSVTISSLFSSLLEEGEGIAVRILVSMKAPLDELYSEFRNRFTHPKRKKKHLLLDEMGDDLTKKALEGKLDPVIGRDDEIKRVLEILLRRCKNNPILIGEAGVGKTAIVEELARKIAFNEVPFKLKNKRIISLSMATIVAGTKYRGEFEDRMNKIIEEVEENNDIILFIDEIHTLVGAGGAEGAIDASNIFKPALARGNIHLIGATTIDEYRKFIEKDAALDRRFQKVLIEVPTKEQVIEILNKLKPIYEKYHNVKLTDDVIPLIVNLSNKYIYDRYEPDKSIDILDEVCSFVHLKDNKEMNKLNLLKMELIKLEENKKDYLKKSLYNEATLMKEKENKIMNDINLLELDLYKKTLIEVTSLDVNTIISMKTGIPINEIKNKINISKFNKELKKVIGQDNAKDIFLKLYKKIKLGLNNRCYSILLMGPSGVGKTMISKIFGNYVSSNVMKLDMSEYSSYESMNKLIGSSKGYVGYEDKNIFDSIRLHPYTVLILDEVEKAHPKILNLFYQILEDSKIEDSKGNVIRFDNVIIIMTTNIGFMDNKVSFKENDSKNKINEYFNVSFINRIDNIITFNYLKEKDILNIIHQKLENIKNKYKDHKITFSKKVEKDILKLSDYQIYGARKIDKIIEDNIEDVIIDNIINLNNNIEINSLKMLELKN